MNLAVRGIDAHPLEQRGQLHGDRTQDLRFDYILANPPF
jgi:type I restriction-modification system DNA methylase subunit